MKTTLIRMSRSVALTFLMWPLAPVPGAAATQGKSWENLKQFRVGQEVQVVDMNLKSLNGTFASLSDDASLLPMTDRVMETCGEWPAQVSADSAFFSVENVVGLETRGIEGFMPDAHLAGELNQRRRPLKSAGDSPEHVRMRPRLRSPLGQARYRRRQALVEPVIGVLKEQRGLRAFRLRGLNKVAVEVGLACTAFNLTRMWRYAARR